MATFNNNNDEFIMLNDKINRIEQHLLFKKRTSKFIHGYIFGINCAIVHYRDHNPMWSGNILDDKYDKNHICIIEFNFVNISIYDNTFVNLSTNCSDIAPEMLNVITKCYKKKN